MKVLHLIDSGGLYGAEKVLLALVKEQLRQGLEPMILSAGSPDIAQKAIEAEAFRLGLPIKPWRMRPGLNMGETRKILAWAKAEGFTLLHSHGYKFNILLALQRRNTKGKGFATVTTLHGYVHARRFSKMWVYELLDRWAIRHIDAVVMVADAMKSQLRLAGAAGKIAEVIPNGIDTNELVARSIEALDPNIIKYCETHDPVVMGVGRFAHEKGFDILIDAFGHIKSAYPEAGLLIAGEGALRSDLELRAKASGLDGSVFFPGYCSNVAACLKNVDILAIPSRTEGLPIVLLEAMALQVPLVTSDVGAMPRTLGFGQGGIVISSLSAKHVHAAMVETLVDTCGRQRRVSWSRQQVESQFSTARMTNSYSQVYRQVLKT